MDSINSLLSGSTLTYRAVIYSYGLFLQFSLVRVVKSKWVQKFKRVNRVL